MLVFGNPIVAGTVLVRPAIQSPNYDPVALTGWAIKADGSAVFHDLTLTGPVVLTYNPSPGAGNLVESDAAASGTDQFGNAYLAGKVTYGPGQAGGREALQQLGHSLIYWTAPNAGGPWTQASSLFLQKGYVTTSQNELLLNTVTFLVPSGDTSGATDQALIQQRLNVGYAVILMPGAYYVNAPISVPSFGSLEGYQAVSLGPGTPPADPPVSIAAVASWAPAGPTGVILFAAAVSPRVANVVIDGSLNTHGNLNGVYSTGATYDDHLDNVYIWKAPGDGISSDGNAHHHRWTSVTAADSGSSGIGLANATDSTFIDVMAFGSAIHGWTMQSLGNCQWTNCRAEWSGQDGFLFTNTSFTGCSFTNCTTDNNGANGIHSTGSTVPTDAPGVTWAGGKFHADRNNAIRIVGNNLPFTFDGTETLVGMVSGSPVPASAVVIGSIGGGAVAFAGCHLGAGTTPWTWDATGVVARSGCISAIGAPGAQTFARLADI